MSVYLEIELGSLREAVQSLITELHLARCKEPSCTHWAHDQARRDEEYRQALAALSEAT